MLDAKKKKAGTKSGNAVVALQLFCTNSVFDVRGFGCLDVVKRKEVKNFLLQTEKIFKFES